MNILKQSRNSLNFSNLLSPPNLGSRLSHPCFFAITLMLAAGLASCGHDAIVPDDDPDVTRQAAADSTAADGKLHIGNIAIDTAWAGQTHIDF